MISEEEFRKCANNPHINKTWYKLTTEVFVAYLFRQETAEASHDAARKYYDETSKEDRSEEGITAAMSAAAKGKLKSMKANFQNLKALEQQREA